VGCKGVKRSAALPDRPGRTGAGKRLPLLQIQTRGAHQSALDNQQEQQRPPRVPSTTYAPTPATPTATNEPSVVTRWADALEQAGAAEHDRVAVMVPTSTGAFAVQLAVSWLGGTVVAINTMLCGQLLARALTITDPVVLVTDLHGPADVAGKTQLALANTSGAMMIQATVPSGLGLQRNECSIAGFCCVRRAPDSKPVSSVPSGCRPSLMPTVWQIRVR
jgi:AMP-binding enzyme